VTVCVASLIAPQWLVTDAHCLMLPPVTPSQIQVRIGSITRGAGGVLDSVSAIVPAPDWDQETATGDVALLRLTRAAPYTPVPIATSPAPVGLAVRTVGWGCSTAPCDVTQIPTVAQTIDTHIVSSGACAVGEIHPDRELCSAPGPDGEQRCQGDSGAPVVDNVDGRWRQVGVVSRGGGSGCKGHPAISVRLAAYAGWIARMTSGG
jgi:secreted trypsin-like serine protease